VIREISLTKQVVPRPDDRGDSDESAGSIERKDKKK
jgi:hypothetical protein